MADAVRILYQARRALFIARIRWLAKWHRSTINLEVASDLRLGRGVRVVVDPRVQMTVRIGPRTRIDDQVLLLLKGGTLDCGPNTWLRRHVVLNVSGHLVLVEGNILSWGAALHCAESVRFEALASAAEGVTVADSTHYYTTPERFFYENTRTEPVVIGHNTWLCPKSTVTQGVRIGSHCILASNSVAITDIPDGHLASGVPASDIRPLRLPWRDRDAATEGAGAERREG
jgi:acetyltransferase-like isoleucine patch superfamily enzyme